MRLTEKRRRVLAALAAQDWQRDGCLTAYEVACKCRQQRNASDWAHAPLREMGGAGLVEIVGVGPSNSATWRITDAGRAALAARGGERG